jgi:chromate transporter
MEVITFFLLALKASLLSTGGLGNLPSLEQDLVSRRWASEGQFGAALAVGQVAPGPSGLWVVSLGYLAFGWPGALAALLAAAIPPLLIVPVDALRDRFGELPAVSDFVQGVSLAFVAVLPIVLLRLVFAHGFDSRALLIFLGAAALAATRRVPPVLLLALAAAAGVALYH